MKINKNINTSIITDNNLQVLEELKGELIIEKLEDLKGLNKPFIVFNDFLRLLNKHEKQILLDNLKKKNIHFVNISSNIEEVLYAENLKVFYHGRVMLEGATLSVLKEEKLLNRLGYRLPFIVELSMRLNSYDLINSIYLENDMLVDKLW